MLMIARLSLPSNADVQTAVGDFSTILQSVGVKTLKNVFLAEELSQLIFFVRSIFFHEQENFFQEQESEQEESGQTGDFISELLV